MIREAILHFDPLQTQVKTECIDQNGLRSVKFIENEDLMQAIRQHTYAPPLHSVCCRRTAWLSPRTRSSGP